MNEFLMNAIAHGLDCPAGSPVEKIDRALYKCTYCGAWVKFDEDGIVVGTIVEGSDAEYNERINLYGVEATEGGAVVLRSRFWEAVQNCEDFASENFGRHGENWRLQEIKDIMENLLSEAKEIIRKNGSKFQYERAKAYWIEPIECALNLQSGGQGSLEETINELAGA